MTDDTEEVRCRPIILNEDDRGDFRVLADYRADPQIEVIDKWEHQISCARRLLSPSGSKLLEKSKWWVYYPWRRTLVSILGPRDFRRLRLDRNRNLITAAEQHRLAELRIGVVGLSVGHAVAYMLAAEGLCGGLRLADADTLELSNLNRVAATVFDLGMNKATVAARRIAELDPYLPVQVMTSGLSESTLEEFIDGLDLVVEECDSLDMKIRVREVARANRIPVLMTTGDRGLVDVERYDVDPSRPILHGLLGDIDIEALAGLSNRDKVPHVLRILDVGRLSARSAASMVEIDQTLETWPQLAGEVALGAAVIAEAVRRLGVGEPLASGRARVDLGQALDQLAEPEFTTDDCPTAAERPADDESIAVESDVAAAIAAAANQAPSGGNAQPWRIELDGDSVVIRLVPERTVSMDVNYRASAVAVGAAWFNARVAAASHGMLGAAGLSAEDGSSPLSAVVRLGTGNDPDLARLGEAILQRESNRHLGDPAQLADTIAAELETAAAAQGARLQLLTTRKDIENTAAILAESDRIRHLTPQLHAEMLSEIRFPTDSCRESGIDLRSLEMDRSELAGLQIISRPEVVEQLAAWGTGSALGKYTRDRVRASSALGVICINGRTLTDYARGGSGLEAVWVTAQQLGLAVHPISPVFLYAHDDSELRSLSPGFATQLSRLQCALRDLTHTKADEHHVMMLRFSHAPAASVRSQRRRLDGIAAAGR